MTGIRISGWGIGVSDKILTNDDLSNTLDTSDKWITERTGIRERRIGGTTAGLAIEAGRNAMEMAGAGPNDIDTLILATTTPDIIVPGTAPLVQHGLGLKTSVAAFDLNAACTGFVYGLIVGHAMIAAGGGRVLLIGSDTLSRVTDWDDRSIAILVGDGAGAVVLDPLANDDDLISWNLNTDGSAHDLLICEHDGYLKMDGKEVFRKAVRLVVESAEQVLSDAGLRPDDITLLVPHQANLRIIQAVCQRLGISEDRAVVVIDRYGNTSSASIPLALNDALNSGRISKGDHLLFAGFGGGMTWASAIMRWGG